MIITLLVGDQCTSAPAADAERLVTAALTSVMPGNPWVNMATGSAAQFYAAPEPLDLDTMEDPFAELSITATMTLTANQDTGYGAVRWNTSHHLVNLRRPADPRVVFDPDVPSWYRPEHTLPLAHVERAAREFVTTGGAQPTCVEWMKIAELSRVCLMSDEYRTLMRPAVA